MKRTIPLPPSQTPRKSDKRARINWDEVDQMLMAGCTTPEIAASIGIARETLYDRSIVDNGVKWGQYAQEKKAAGEKVLRQKQYDLAAEGDRKLLIWLGKNRLKQSDRQAVEHTIIRDEDQIIQK